MEISILNNPLYIAYTLHPGSKLAKVLPEDCHLMDDLIVRKYFKIENAMDVGKPA